MQGAAAAPGAQRAPAAPGRPPGSPGDPPRTAPGAPGAPAPPAPANGRAAGGASQGAKVGRNDPCWCGSGKKYKLCHGAA
ncbi:MAG: SEC-C metal-binding domain-containing protein [Acidimicrobiales bacterium]